MTTDRQMQEIAEKRHTAEETANTRLGYVQSTRIESMYSNCYGRIPVGHKGIMVDSGGLTNSVIWDRLPICVDGCEKCSASFCLRLDRISPRRVIIIG